jgi:hypothetical protein
MTRRLAELIASTHSWEVFSALFGTVSLNILESTITLKLVELTCKSQERKWREREVRDIEADRLRLTYSACGAF